VGHEAQEVGAGAVLVADAVKPLCKEVLAHLHTRGLQGGIPIVPVRSLVRRACLQAGRIHGFPLRMM
jgi:hypothetical protein